VENNVIRDSPDYSQPLPGWPERLGAIVGAAIAGMSLWAFPAVMFGCVIVAVMGAR